MSSKKKRLVALGIVAYMAASYFVYRLEVEQEQSSRDACEQNNTPVAETVNFQISNDTLKTLRKLASTLDKDTIDDPEYDADSYFQEHYDDFTSDPEDIISYPETDFDANLD